jgi:large subunit ribosomal protein L17
MRHHRNTQTLSRFSSYYKATIRALARSVLINQRIITTHVRAKLTRGLVDKLINLGKQMDSLSARRQANAILNDHALVKTLFTQIGPRFTEMNGGYTRITPYKRRRGDNAELVVLELSMITTIAKPVQEKKPAVPKKADAEKPSKEEHKDVAPPEKEKHKKEPKKPSKKILGGFGKFFKSERDSL